MSIAKSTRHGERSKAVSHPKLRLSSQGVARLQSLVGKRIGFRILGGCVAFGDRFAEAREVILSSWLPESRFTSKYTFIGVRDCRRYFENQWEVDGFRVVDRRCKKFMERIGRWNSVHHRWMLDLTGLDVGTSREDVVAQIKILEETAEFESYDDNEVKILIDLDRRIELIFNSGTGVAIEVGHWNEAPFFLCSLSARPMDKPINSLRTRITLH